MTQHQTSRSRVLRRIAVALATTMAVSTVAASSGQAASPAVTGDLYGGTAKVAIFDTFPGWCFGNNPANSSLMAARTVYETLFEKDADNNLVGLLAESAAAIPGTNMTMWSVKIRDNVFFHDGTKMTAKAVKQNIDAFTSTDYLLTTLAQPAVYANWTTSQKNAYAETLEIELAKGKTQAKAAETAGLAALTKSKASQDLAYTIGTATAFAANILYTVADDAKRTVTLFLDRPQNDVKGMLYASGRTFMRAPSQFENGATQCSTLPIGTGPFKVKSARSWSLNKLTVTRNTNYWRSDAAGNKLPFLDGIVFTNVKEGSLRAGAVAKGTYDAGMFSAGGDGLQIKTLRKQKSKVAETKSPVEYYPSLWLNQGRTGSPFANKNARLAVTTCLDRANYVKVRGFGEIKAAKALVGPTSVMYTTTGFGKYNLAKAKNYVKAYKTETKAKSLKFTIPSDTSSASIANVKFLQNMWKKCGITAVVKTKETAVIIAEAFNASPDLTAGEYYNAYDAIIILLMEGTDVSFNMPFVLSNAFSTGTSGKTFGAGLATNPALGAAGATLATASYVKSLAFDGLGSVLSLNHHSDKTIDDLFFAGQAATDDAVATAKFKEGTAKLQSEAIMSSIAHIYYTLFVNKKSGLSNIGVVTLPDAAKSQRKMTNWGIDWSGVQKPD
jgi:ABC-type transport system substrate-binding protein